MSWAKRCMVGTAIVTLAAGCRGGGEGAEPTSNGTPYVVPWVTGVSHAKSHSGLESAFEEWRWAVVEHKYDEIFPRLTSEMRAYELAAAHGGELLRGMVPLSARLDEDARLLIGRWVEENRAAIQDLERHRPGPLPRPIDESGWLYYVLRENYGRRADTMASYVEGSEVEGVSVVENDPDGQVLVRLRDNRRDTYHFLYVNGAWLLDWTLSRGR